MSLRVWVHGRRRAVLNGSAIRLGVRRWLIAVHTLMATTTATAAGSAASKATAGAFGSAAYTSRDTGNHRDKDESADDDCDNNWPSVACE